uniref:Innexin n=1 Tax=Acrobeloides nanus TaxID=290746 RepID=A0A914CAY9_9BILA
MFFHATLARHFIQSLRVRGDDDFVDRLNYYYTPIMLAVACLIISAKQYGGTPIECWVNPHSRESMEEYIESFCWIQNTYWVPMFENIPDDHTAREQQQIGYYQWVPFILIAEALMFSIPCILWRLLNWQAGLNIQQVVAAACDARAIVDQESRDKVMESVSQSLIDILDIQDARPIPHPSASWSSKIKCHRFFRGHYVTMLYICIKILYTFNIMVLSDLIAGKPWSESGHFPRVTLCDFEVRYLANLNRYTVQCALLINILNEKVFAFFWCWYLVLVIITTFSALFWLTNFIVQSERVDYVLKYMQIAASSDKEKRRKYYKDASRNPDENVKEAFHLPDPYLLNKFVHEFLKTDGIFTLRLMANHAGELVVVTVVKSLWKEFQDRNWREFEEYEVYKRDHSKFHAHHNKLKVKKPFMEFLHDRKSNHTTFSAEDVIVSSPIAPKLADSTENQVLV